MEELLESVPSSEQLDLETIRSRVQALSEVLRTSKEFSELSPSESDKLLKECVIGLENRIEECMSEFSDFSALGIEDLDTYLENAKEELNLIEAENLKIYNEIEVLSGSFIEDSTELERDLEGLNCSLKFIELQNQHKLEIGTDVAHSVPTGGSETFDRTHEDNFKVLELDNQIEKNKVTLNSLQDLCDILKRSEAVRQIEDTLTGLKVIELEGNCIRLSLKTFLPNLESLLRHQKMEYAIDPPAVDHELLIEVFDGTMELKNVEIFPNDVFIGEIVDSAKSRQFCPSLAVLEMGSSLEWLVRKVQSRIVSSSLRRLLVNDANKSRHSFEYSDRDEIIIAHMVGGINAFIKLPQSWPMLTCALKLISLKNSDNHSRVISLSFLCKVEEIANSLDVQIRQNLVSFVDAIEGILVQQMRSELHTP